MNLNLNFQRLPRHTSTAPFYWNTKGQLLHRGDREVSADPPQATCPVLLFFFLPHFDPGRKQDWNQFHVFLFFHFLNIVTSYMKVWQFRFWCKWSLISYLDSGASIASSTKFLPVKRYFSSQLAKKPFNGTLICFTFLLLMHRFSKNRCLNASYLF